MRITPRHFSFAAFLHRLMASGGAALVLALAVFAASPDLHAWLHVDSGAGDDECAVALFAGGVAAPASALTIALTTIEWKVPAYRSVDELFLASPRYLHQPERGPPLS
jgi:hypothetical protein